MAHLPEEQKAKIAEQVASFQEEKSKLDAEVSKWDDSGNDIIVLAKQMCMIMMEMTDFTRWVLVDCFKEYLWLVITVMYLHGAKIRAACQLPPCSHQYSVVVHFRQNAFQVRLHI